ncbi:hypothetical protein [Acerihabitans arboris]|uniref:hypothetical protein n=1 Tax=Acerihabitans arboris TaxID=2691583 RepID=UPI00406BAECA
MEIDSTRIDDPVLAQEVADFTRDSYGRARAKLFMGRPELSEAQMDDVTWIGSQYYWRPAFGMIHVRGRAGGLINGLRQACRSISLDAALDCLPDQADIRSSSDGYSRRPPRY